MSKVRASSVAAIIRSNEHTGPELLLIRRSEQLGDAWSGHIAMPGGRAEASDQTIVDTAIRETFEEVGLNLSRPHAQLLGSLPVLQPRLEHAPALDVYPFMWQLTDPTAVATVSDEVAAVHWVSFDYLKDTANTITHSVKDHAGNTLKFPAIQLADDDVLWGITYRIVKSIFETITL